MMGEVENQRGLIAAGLILVCCAVLALVGCSQQPLSPASYSNDPLDALSNTGGDNDGGPASVETTLVATASLSEAVGANGKVLRLTLDKRVIVFNVPKNALTETVTITITGSKYEIGEEEFYVYDCGPDGQQFLEPILLTQPVALTNGQPLVLLYFDDTLEDGDGIGWQVEDAGVSANGRGIFEIHHFSKYGISYTPEPSVNEEGFGGLNTQ
ncbi:MAG: hypothetical protein IT585_01170 [candidate division Zixibacteria bacterium]|nr:hypothetical protein [candidate division Zixibacteria bacterium]